MICLVLNALTLEENLELVNKYRRYIDLVELRADFLAADELSSISVFPSLVDLPVILTLRRISDGGKYVGDESGRIALLERGVSGEKPFAFIDLEEDLPKRAGLESLVQSRGTRVIRSLHDFSGIPSDFERKIGSIPRTPLEILKAAVTPRSTADLLRLYEYAGILKRYERASGSSHILLGMGAFGIPSRILSAGFGSLFTYASPAGTQAAPGHLDPETLETVYGFHAIGESTAVYGIVGNPVMHTQSPRIHNPAFRKLKIDAVYVPFQLDDIAVLPDLVSTFGLKGLSVTVPHKEAVIPYLYEADEAVRQTRACNTIIAAEGGLSGFNTDAEGFLAPLLTAGIKLEGLPVTVLGAGGSARSVVYGLTSLNARVLILNRTPDRARELAGEFGCDWGALDSDGLTRMREFNGLVVQTTSAGMPPQESADPSEGYEFTGAETAYDIVYQPAMTKFLSRAERAGCRIIRGGEMLRAQAYGQFRLFTGKRYPVT